MFTMRFMSLGLCALLLATAGVQAQEQKRRPAAAAQEQPGGPLVSKAVEERLKLTADQKEKLAKIEKEFADKAKDEAKQRELLEKAKQDKDRAAYKEALEKINEAKKVRAEFQSKVTALLTDEQKRAFEPAAGTERRPGAAQAQGASPFLPGAIQERLGLSAEQKEKLNQLQKEFESKSLQVLTDEQRQKYEQFKKGRTRPQQQQSQRRPGASRQQGTTPPAIGRLR